MSVPGPGLLRELDKHLVDAADEIEDLLAYHRNQVLCPVYTSVDIRRNRHKAAVIDANAFPAGFNNLAPQSHGEAQEVIGGYIEKMYPGASEILVLGESHTRNAWYFENLKTLGELFAGAGLDVTLGTLNPELFPSRTVETARGSSITLHGVLREDDALIADGKVHDVVILNNDLSEGQPDILDDLSQPVTPPPVMGWHRRRKSEHFRIVGELARQMGAHADFDPWLMSTVFERVDGVDFKARQGIEDVAAAVDRVMADVQARFDKYGIEREPNVFVKADAGTYGMGITTAKSGEEFLAINSKGREKMDRGKGRTKTTSVIVQEGVTTDLTRDGGGAAEPVIYMVCGRVVGGFHRVHEARGDQENLNAPGSTFEPFTLGADDGPHAGLDDVTRHVFQVLGEVASIATGYELRFADEVGSPLPDYD